MAWVGLALLSACATAHPANTPARVSLTVVTRGEAGAVERVRGALAKETEVPVEVRLAELPTVRVEKAGPDDIAARLSTARRSYVRAAFGACLEAIVPQPAIADLLAAKRRDAAARVLFWRIACRVGSGAAAEAKREAREFAVLGLDIPLDVGTATPEVEALLTAQIQKVADERKLPVDVTADVGGASVSVDGRPAACTAPCTLDLVAGNHVVGVEADGIVPAVRSVRVEAARLPVRFETSAAPPELAAEQWKLRYAGSPAVESTPSVRLLARAIRARRLALLTAEGGGAEPVHLRAVLALDGAVSARSERSGRAVDRETELLLRDLLVTGRVLEPAPGLFRRPSFWVAMGLAAAAAAGAAVLLLYKPAPRVEVGF